jgi:hypothetical protein
MKKLFDKLSGYDFLGKHFVYFVVGIIFIKLVLLPWTSHPFDFWSFVNTIERNTLYGWPVFEYWNKGNPLLLLWYPEYSLYSKIIEYLSLLPNNLPLLHFFFKLPFLFVDLLIGWLVYQVISIFGADKRTARASFLFWFLSPLVYYVYGIHGHYELLVPLAIMLMLYGALKKIPILLALGIVLGFTTKYFIIILVPFFFLFLIQNPRLIWQTILWSVLGVGLSYIHLFLAPELLGQTIGSIFSLSGSNAPLGVDARSVSPLNLFSALNTLRGGTGAINSVAHPGVFSVVNQGILLAGAILLGHIGYRAVKIFKNRQPYSPIELLVDVMLAIIYFLVLLTNFQPHYFGWVLPLLFVAVFIEKKLLYPLIALTVVGFIYQFKNEIGPKTFFINFGAPYDVYTFVDASFGVMYKIGAVVIATLGVIFSMSVISKFKQTVTEDGIFKRYLPITLLCWLVLVIPYIQYVPYYLKNAEKIENKLSFNNNVYRQGLIASYYQATETESTTIKFNKKSANNSLLLDYLVDMSEEQKSNFRAYVIIPLDESTPQIDRVLDSATLNSCSPLEPSRDKFATLDVQSKNHRLFQISTNCLKKSDNLITFEPADLPRKLDVKLFVMSEYVERPYLANQVRIINTTSLIGLLYVLLFIGGSVKIIKYLARESR